MGDSLQGGRSMTNPPSPEDRTVTIMFIVAGILGVGLFGGSLLWIMLR